MISKIKNFFCDEQYSEARREIRESSKTSVKIDNIVRLPKEYASINIGNDVFNDIEMFVPYRDDTQEKFSTIYKVLDFTHFQGSHIYLRSLISKPVNDIDILLDRQKTLKRLEETSDSITQVLQDMPQIENDILWLFEDRDSNIKALYEMVYLKFWIFKKGNDIPLALTSYNMYKILLSPIIGIVSPIMYFVVPYFVLVYRYKLKIGFKSYLQLIFESSKMMFKLNGWSARLQYASYIFSLVFYFQSIFSSIELSKTLFSIADLIVEKMKSISMFIEKGTTILEKEENIEEFFNVILEKDFTKIITPKDGNRWHWFFSNFGDSLKFYKNIDKEWVKDFLTRIYCIDAINSIVRCKQENRLCYVNYVVNNEKETLINLESFWHPCIDKKVAVPNNIHLTRINRNMIITGPNAGGKSTIIKSILSNILLAQTIGVAFAKQCEINPFKFINSQISIPDCKGKESLFQAEMNRCKMNFQAIDELSESETGIVFMDEILNSTNPIEGIAGSYAILKKLSKFKNCIVVFTTHFVYLTKLAKSGSAFSNYKMNVEMDIDGKFKFPYVLKSGISQQYIAIDLLQNEGFDDEIIQEAKALKDKLCAFKENRKDISSVKNHEV